MHKWEFLWDILREVKLLGNSIWTSSPLLSNYSPKWLSKKLIFAFCPQSHGCDLHRTVSCHFLSLIMNNTEDLLSLWANGFHFYELSMFYIRLFFFLTDLLFSPSTLDSNILAAICISDIFSQAVALPFSFIYSTICCTKGYTF